MHLKILRTFGSQQPLSSEPLSVLMEMSVEVLSVLSMVSVIMLLSAILRMTFRIEKLGQFVSNGMGGLVTMITFIEKRIDKARGCFRDQIGHAAQTIQDFDSSIDKDWLLRWLRDEYECLIATAIVRGVNNSGMRPLWMVLLSASVSKVRAGAIFFKWEGDEDNMRRLEKNIEILRTTEYGCFYEDISVSQEKASGSTSRSVLHDIAMSFWVQDIGALEKLKEQDEKFQKAPQHVWVDYKGEARFVLFLCLFLFC